MRNVPAQIHQHYVAVQVIARDVIPCDAAMPRTDARDRVACAATLQMPPTVERGV